MSRKQKKGGKKNERRRYILHELEAPIKSRRYERMRRKGEDMRGKREGGLQKEEEGRDKGDLCAGTEDVLLGDLVVGGDEAVDGVEVVPGGVVQLELGGACICSPDCWVSPEGLDVLSYGRGEGPGELGPAGLVHEPLGLLLVLRDLYAHVGSRSHKHPHGAHSVARNDAFVTLPFLVVESIHEQKFHLFCYGTLPTLSSAKKQQLYL